LRILLTADPALPVPPKLYGGIERIIALLGQKLCEREHKVGLLAHSDSTSAVTERFAWPSVSSGHVAHVRSLRKAVRAFQPEIVHSFSRLLYLATILGSRGLPKIMSYQREPSRRTVGWANRLGSGSLTFTGCSESISAQGRRGGGTWQTIHNFVDLERYTFQPRVPNDAPLLFLSRVEPIKGAHLAIEACRRTGRRLIIAGNHSEQENEEGRYWREVIRPQIDGREIEYVGPIDDSKKNELLGQSAALIVPVQWNEPFGIVFAEALACGTPVISCPRGALPEIVRNGIDGYLVKDAGQAANAIDTLPLINRAFCRGHAEKCFSAEAIVPQYEKIYQQMLKAAR
jgi:glycosyltransferase involved in cell wall biosynthesis